MPADAASLVATSDELPGTAAEPLGDAVIVPPEPDGRIVTVEPALIVRLFCRICVAVRLAALVPSPTVVLPA